MGRQTKFGNMNKTHFYASMSIFPHFFAFPPDFMCCALIWFCTYEFHVFFLLFGLLPCVYMVVDFYAYVCARSSVFVLTSFFYVLSFITFLSTGIVQMRVLVCLSVCTYVPWIFYCTLFAG